MIIKNFNTEGNRRSGQNGGKSPETRWVPEGEFVASIDQLLGKHLPEKSVPWTTSRPPVWAQGFSPRVIVDLGCGVGGFTRSVLTCLGKWGCLSQLERIVLVERDTTILPGGASALRKHLLTIVTDVLSTFGKGKIAVEVLFESIELIASGHCRFSPVIPLLNHCCVKADLIVSSHVTYYFGDGSGRELIASLCRYYLAPHGRLWCVIRKRQCPIYEVRALALKELDLSDVKPFDYAEYFEQKVIPQLKGVTLLDKRDQWFLRTDADSLRMEAAYWLMWREIPPTELITPFGKAVSGLIVQEGPLFAERHFVLEGKDGEE